MQVGVKDFRSHLADYLQRVAQGEDIVIVKGGKPIARLVPTESPAEAATARIAAYAHLAVVGDVISPFDEVWEADQ